MTAQKQECIVFLNVLTGDIYFRSGSFSCISTAVVNPTVLYLYSADFEKSIFDLTFVDKFNIVTFHDVCFGVVLIGLCPAHSGVVLLLWQQTVQKHSFARCHTIEARFLPDLLFIVLGH